MKPFIQEGDCVACVVKDRILFISGNKDYYLTKQQLALIEISVMHLRGKEVVNLRIIDVCGSGHVFYFPNYESARKVFDYLIEFRDS